MPAAQKIEPAQSASTSIITIVAQTPVVVLIDEQKREQLYAHIQREVDAFEPDLTTIKGRDAIKSLAFKITRTKTAIDAAGKELNEDARAKINAVDAARRDAREKLDAMAKAVRQPLTEWEEAEEKRVEWCRGVIADFARGMVVTMDDTAETVRLRGQAAFNVIVKPETFGDMFAEAQAAKDLAVETLKAARARLLKEEEDRAELERLRQEAAERAEADRLAAEEAAKVEAAKEAARREAEEAAAYEERRIAAEKAEAERLERAREEAAAAARREAEETAQREREEAERAKQAQIDAANERARQAEEDARRQRQQAERAEQERAEATEREAAEQRKREANRAHRSRVMSDAKAALMTCGADEETAKKIVLAIVAGEVPAVTLRF